MISLIKGESNEANRGIPSFALLQPIIPSLDRRCSQLLHARLRLKSWMQKIQASHMLDITTQLIQPVHRHQDSSNSECLLRYRRRRDGKGPLHHLVKKWGLKGLAFQFELRTWDVGMYICTPYICIRIRKRDPIITIICTL